MNDYKGDSTRGKSKIEPINYKGDVIVQVWLDSRILATLDRWLDEHGDRVKFLSEVVKRPLEMAVESLVDRGEVEMIEDTGEARYLLSERFKINLNRGERGKKNLLHNIVLSDRRGLSGECSEQKIGDVGGRSRKYSDLTMEAVRIFNELGDEKVVTKEKMSEEEIESKFREIERSDKEEQMKLDEFLQSQK